MQQENNDFSLCKFSKKQMKISPVIRTFMIKDEWGMRTKKVCENLSVNRKHPENFFKAVTFRLVLLCY